jgi:ParG
MKTVSFKSVVSPPASAEDWVKGAGRNPEARLAAAEPIEPMKRLTIDVPLSLHTRLKTGCAASGRKIADVVRALIEEEFPPPS